MTDTPRFAGFDLTAVLADPSTAALPPVRTASEVQPFVAAVAHAAAEDPTRVPSLLAFLTRMPAPVRVMAHAELLNRSGTMPRSVVSAVFNAGALFKTVKASCVAMYAALREVESGISLLALGKRPWSGVRSFRLHRAMNNRAARRARDLRHHIDLAEAIDAHYQAESGDAEPQAALRNAAIVSDTAAVAVIEREVRNLRRRASVVPKSRRHRRKRLL